MFYLDKLNNRLRKDVRFEVQTYTDKGPTNKFKNGYNPKDKLKK